VRQPVGGQRQHGRDCVRGREGAEHAGRGRGQRVTNRGARQRLPGGVASTTAAAASAGATAAVSRAKQRLQRARKASLPCPAVAVGRHVRRWQPLHGDVRGGRHAGLHKVAAGGAGYDAAAAAAAAAGHMRGRRVLGAAVSGAGIPRQLPRGVDGTVVSRGGRERVGA
jgi:hypothetical protein